MREFDLNIRRATVVRRDYQRGDPGEHPFEQILWQR